MNFAPIPGTAVIGLGHKARHGKDTAAEAIIASEPGTKRYSFADDLYAVARVLYGMTTKDAPLLQRVGVEFREKDADVWVRSVYSKILQDRPTLAVITDVRFPNEFDFVKSLGGLCMKVSRVNEDGTPFVDPSRPAAHISETANDRMPWDFIVTARSGDVSYLRTMARHFARNVLALAVVA